MYGNQRLPGIEASDTYRYEGSIWRGYPETTWFKTVKATGTLAQGTIVKENAGIYSPITTEDIISSTANLPGVRLGIVADNTAPAGTAESPATVLIGIQGQVDKDKLFVGETAFSELTNTQKINLNTQLEAWNFQLVKVEQR